MALLEIRDMHTSYGNIKAVKGISFEVDQGEIVTLIGSNGAGKSTTLNTIVGTVPIASGEIWFNGANITKLPCHERVALGIALSPEGRQVFPEFSVEANLRMGAYTMSKSELAEGQEQAYTLFPTLKERRRQAAGTLSGGEQQMLAIARSLISNPRMILLDEPSLGLAPIIIHEIFEAIKEIDYQEGKTILFVEQNARIALKTASRGYVFQNGEIIVEDTSENLESNPQIQKAYLGG